MIKNNLCAAGVLVAVGLGAGGAGAETLQNAVQTAVTTNPRIESISANREAVEQELRQARGLYLPQVDVGVGYGPEWTEDIDTRAAGEGTVRFERFDADAQVSQRIFDGFEARYEVRKQKARIVSAARRVQDNAEVVGLDAVGAYLEVLRQRDLVQLAEELVRAHMDILDRIEERVESGASGNADLSQTRVRLNRSRAALTQQFNALRDAEANYERVVGSLPPDLEKPNFPLQQLPNNVESAVEIATRENPKLLIADADIEVAEQEVELANSPFYPKINLEADTAYYNDRDGIDGWEWQARIMLRLRWNLYRGGIDKATYREFAHRLNQAKAERTEAYRAATEDMKNSWFAMEAQAQRVSQLEEAVQASVETRDAYHEEFLIARRTLLDLLDGENELFVSRAQLTTAQYNYQRAGYRVLAVAGMLLQTLNVTPPQQANEAYKTFHQDVFGD